MKRILAMLCSFVVACGAFAGCSQVGADSDGDDSSSSQMQSSSTNKPIEEYSPEPLTDNGVDLSNYKIVISASANESTKYAAHIFQSNILSATNINIPIISDASPEGDYEIIIGKTTRADCALFDYDALGVESFKVQALGKNLFIAGNERGAIYGVYAYLEALGFRYYAVGVNKIPGASKVFIAKDVEIEWTPTFTFRDPFFESANDLYEDSLGATEWAVSQRINSSFQRSRLRSEKKYGGSAGWIGGDGMMVHTVGKLLPYDPDHPDWFSENGANPCFTNEEAMQALYTQVLRTIDLDTAANVIDISMNDNGEYCKCETCLASYEQYGVSETYYRAINDIAKKLKVDRPERKDLMVNTLSYAFALEPPKELVLEDNMTITLCLSMCRFHTDPEECHEMGMLYSDPTTEIRSLKTEQERLLGWEGHASSIRVWYYGANWGMLYASDPSYEAMYENFRFFAENNVIGIYSECYSRKNPEFGELKAYLTAKMMANPYMSKEEYYYHMDDFLQGYYGDGWDLIREYIDKSYQQILFDMSKTGHLAHWYALDENFQLDYDPKTKEFASFVNEFDKLWDEAEEYANTQQLERIRKSRLHWDYINLYNTWDRRMENASIAERKELIEKNKTLYERIKRYGILQRYDNDATIRSVSDFSLSPALWWH